MDRTLNIETLEGEIALVIDYRPGVSPAVEVLSGAMALIESLDRLDHALLSSVDTRLEPVSILNDVQHSSLKILLARALRCVPDDAIGNLDWKKWAGGLLVKGKHKLLARLDADAPAVRAVLVDLTEDYKAAPRLVGYEPPSLVDVQAALDGVSRARSRFTGQSVIVQSEYGDIVLPDNFPAAPVEASLDVATKLVNRGREFFKVKSTDMLGQAQWTVVRNGRAVKVDILHKAWLEQYQHRAQAILPGDSLECEFEETVFYDVNQNEIERRLSLVEVFRVVTPPVQDSLSLPE